jgi:hypothetical protein
MFKEGGIYTRQKISETVGGGTQECLCHVGGRVVAICMRKDMNPEVPRVLLVGAGPIKHKYSNILCSMQQNEAIPVFIKKYSKAWEFQGNFKVDNNSVDASVIAGYERTSGRNDVQMIVYLARVQMTGRA